MHPVRIQSIQDAGHHLGKHPEPGGTAGGGHVADGLCAVRVEEGRRREVEHYRESAREGEPQSLVADRLGVWVQQPPEGRRERSSPRPVRA